MTTDTAQSRTKNVALSHGKERPKRKDECKLPSVGIAPGIFFLKFYTHSRTFWCFLASFRKILRAAKRCSRPSIFLWEGRIAHIAPPRGAISGGAMWSMHPPGSTPLY